MPYLFDYDAVKPGGTGINSIPPSGEQVRYFIEDVANLKARGAVSAQIVNVIVPKSLLNGLIEMHVLALVGLDADGERVGVALPCPPYCHLLDGSEPVAGLKMPWTAAMAYIGS